MFPPLTIAFKATFLVLAIPTYRLMKVSTYDTLQSVRPKVGFHFWLWRRTSTVLFRISATLIDGSHHRLPTKKIDVEEVM